MDLKEFEGKSMNETQEMLQEKLDAFKEKLNDLKELEDFKKLELEVDKEQEEFDNYLKTVEYDLSEEDVEFDDKKYSPRDVARKIIYYLNKNEQSFEYCLGLHGLVLFWKNPDVKTVSYGVYDSTLRILGKQKYKGDSEWVDILVINNYLTNIHEAYFKDRSILVTLAEMRNQVVQQIELHKPVGQSEEK